MEEGNYFWVSAFLWVSIFNSALCEFFYISAMLILKWMKMVTFLMIKIL
jgi:hypothetical protein